MEWGICIRGLGLGWDEGFFFVWKILYIFIGGCEVLKEMMRVFRVGVSIGAGF